MSADGALREAERRGDRRRALRESLRSGRTTDERLYVAALCGDEDARSIMGTLEASTVPAFVDALTAVCSKWVCVYALACALEHAGTVAGRANGLEMHHQAQCLHDTWSWLAAQGEEAQHAAALALQESKDQAAADAGMAEDECPWYGGATLLVFLPEPRAINEKGGHGWVWGVLMSARWNDAAWAMAGWDWSNYAWMQGVDPLPSAEGAREACALSMLLATKQRLRKWAETGEAM